ncbi:interferon lambda receptor 1 isoform X2 [Melanotaenia boesemani]|uniref:interferon lambda receptor 1 isoform X2 n=1 Tax=Melanotaenia boesemani TaxID=1250792 RepID=UPI001C03C52B|nr:interferon lambda receptor 1 isoform X2 [Melanotaenia boesemani]
MMRSMNVISLLLFCYACFSFGNSEVYFISKNFFNVLRWDPVKPAFPGQKVLYSVQYCNDFDEQCEIKKECQNMAGLSCDLTAETPSVHDVHYVAKVCVNDTSCGFSTRFKPLRDTILGPPILSTHTTASSVYVDVTLPQGPDGESIADIITKSKDGFSKTVPLYILKITKPEWAEQVYESTTNHFDIKMRYNQTEYCGYVVYKPKSEWGSSESENASFCFRLTDDQLVNLKWPLVSVAVLGAMLIISVVCMYSYVNGGKPKEPQALETFSKPNKAILYPDGKILISKVLLYTPSEEMVCTAIQEKQKVPSQMSGGYSPQNIPSYICQQNADLPEDTGACSTTPDPESTSAQSSEIYSQVAVHVTPEADEDFPHRIFLFSSGEESWENGEMAQKYNSCGATPLSDSDSGEINPAKRLLLNTVRNINGQLVLPLFAFQLQSSTGDTISPMNPERKPLLSDLIDCQDGLSMVSPQSFDGSDCTDSGCDNSFTTTPTNPYCNQHYHHSQQESC